jgi:hypothetical protein
VTQKLSFESAGTARLTHGVAAERRDVAKHDDIVTRVAFEREPQRRRGDVGLSTSRKASNCCDLRRASPVARLVEGRRGCCGRRDERPPSDPMHRAVGDDRAVGRHLHPEMLAVQSWLRGESRRPSAATPLRRGVVANVRPTSCGAMRTVASCALGFSTATGFRIFADPSAKCLRRRIRHARERVSPPPAASREVGRAFRRDWQIRIDDRTHVRGLGTVAVGSVTRAVAPTTQRSVTVLPALSSTM